MCSKVLQNYRKGSPKLCGIGKVIKANLLSLKIQKNMQTSEELSPLHHKDTGGTFVHSSWAQVFLDLFLSLAKEYF